MLEEAPKTITWVSWLILSVFMMEAGKRITGDWRTFVTAFAFVFLFVSIVELAYWFIFRVTSRVRVIMEMRGVTEQVLIYREFARLNEYQLKTLQVLSPSVLFMPGKPFPTTYLLRVGGGEVPYDFIHQFLDLGDRMYLCPVGTFAEGTNQRRWAQLLTHHLVNQGFAEQAAGNRPARWLDMAGALNWMGLDGNVTL